MERRSLLGLPSVLAMQSAHPAHGQAPFAPATFNIAEFGATAGGKTLATEAFARAAQACAGAGGGTILVPSGEFLSGPINLPSNSVLYLAPGATVKASPRLSDYPTEPDSLSGESSRAGLVTCRNATNVAILGRGILDGNAMPFHQEKAKGGKDWDARYTRQKADYMHPRFGTETGPLEHGERPGNVVRFIGCRNVLLNGVTVQNSPTWTMMFHECEDVDIDGLNINSLGSGRRIPNDDGMDLRVCSNVRVSNCNIQTGDDCIAIFGSRNVAVSNCNLSARSAGIRVGYAEGDSRACVFQNLTIDSNCGLKVNVRASGSVEDILFSNIVMRTGLITGHWWGKGEPVNVSAVAGQPAGPLGRIRGVRFQDIVADSENSALVYGDPQSTIEDVVFRNFDLMIRNSKLQASYGGNFDLRGAADLSEALFQHDTPGFYFRHVRGLRLENCRLRWDDPVSDFFSYGIEGERFEDVLIDGFEGRSAHPAEQACIALREGDGIAVRNCRAARGTRLFLFQSNVRNQGLFAGNDLAEAKLAFDANEPGFTLVGNRMRG